MADPENTRDGGCTCGGRLDEIGGADHRQGCGSTSVPTVELLIRAADAAGDAASAAEAQVANSRIDWADGIRMAVGLSMPRKTLCSASGPAHWRAVERTFRAQLGLHTIWQDGRSRVCRGCKESLAPFEDTCATLLTLRLLAEQALRDLGERRQSEMPVGSVITLGHPANQRLAAKGVNGWRLLHNGELVDPEEFRGGWDDYSPTEHPCEAS